MVVLFYRYVGEYARPIRRRRRPAGGPSARRPDNAMEDPMVVTRDVAIPLREIVVRDQPLVRPGRPARERDRLARGGELRRGRLAVARRGPARARDGAVRPGRPRRRPGRAQPGAQPRARARAAARPPRPRAARPAHPPRDAADEARAACAASRPSAARRSARPTAGGPARSSRLNAAYRTLRASRSAASRPSAVSRRYVVSPRTHSSVLPASRFGGVTTCGSPERNTPIAPSTSTLSTVVPAPRSFLTSAGRRRAAWSAARRRRASRPGRPGRAR